MKIILLAYDLTMKSINKKTCILLLTALFFCIGIPLLTTPFFGLGEAQQVLMLEQYAAQFKGSTNMYIYHFYPIIVGICFSLLYCDTLLKGREYVYLSSGTKRIEMQAAKWLWLIVYQSLFYFVAFIIYQVILLITGFGKFDINDLHLFFIIFCNSILISFFSALLINISKSSLIGMLPPLIYYMFNFINGNTQFTITETSFFKIFYIFMPVFLTTGESLQGISTNHLSSLFTPYYAILYLCIVSSLSFLVYKKSDL